MVRIFAPSIMDTQEACRHFAGYTGVKVSPQRGADRHKIELKVYHCKQFGSCTLNRRGNGINAVCVSCEHNPRRESIIATQGPLQLIPSKPQSKIRELPCIYFIDRPVSKTNRNGDPTDCKTKWTYGCELHGECSRMYESKREGVKCCQDCDDYVEDS